MPAAGIIDRLAHIHTPLSLSLYSMNVTSKGSPLFSFVFTSRSRHHCHHHLYSVSLYLYFMSVHAYPPLISLDPFVRSSRLLILLLFGCAFGHGMARALYFFLRLPNKEEWGRGHAAVSTQNSTSNSTNQK